MDWCAQQGIVSFEAYQGGKDTKIGDRAQNSLDRHYCRMKKKANKIKIRVASEIVPRVNRNFYRII